MIENSSPNQIEYHLERYFRSGAPRPGFISSLRQELLGEIEHLNRPASRRTWLPPRKRLPAWRYLAPILLSIFLLTVLAVGPQQVLAAIQNLLGYIPGLGFVQHPETALVLLQPVSESQEDVQLTVVDGVADESNIRLLIKVENIRDLWTGDSSGTFDYSIPSTPQLIYHSGSLLVDHYAQVSVGATSITMELVFPPLPQNVSDPTLFLPHILYLPKGIVPDNWSVPLHFTAGSLNGHIRDMVEPLQLADTQNGITLSLDSLIRMSENDILRIGMTSSQPGTQVKYAYSELLLWTADSHPIPFVTEKIIDPPFVTVKTFQSQRLVPGQSYILKMESPVILSKQIPAGGAQSEFSLDLGPDPQIGQQWRVDQTLSVDGQQIRLTSVQLALDTQGYRLEFGVEPIAGMSGIQLMQTSASPAVVFSLPGITTTDANDTTRHTNPTLSYKQLPTEALHFRVSNINYLVQGPWSITWTMPDLPMQP